MKTTIVFLASLVALAVRAFAGDTFYLELRCSPVYPTTNYAVPAGRVIQLVDYFGPSSSGSDIFGSAVRVRYNRPEGSTYATMGIPSTVMGPCTIEMLWTKELHPSIGVYWATLKEFDAIESGPSVKLSLEASTNLPNFGPASAYFRTGIRLLPDRQSSVRASGRSGRDRAPGQPAIFVLMDRVGEWPARCQSSVGCRLAASRPLPDLGHGLPASEGTAFKRSREIRRAEPFAGPSCSGLSCGCHGWRDG